MITHSANLDQIGAPQPDGTVSTFNKTSPVVNYSETAKAIRTVRKSLGLDQAEFASTIANVDKNTISRWERGKTKPDKFRLEWIKEKLPHDVASMLVYLKGFGDRGALDENQSNVRDNAKNHRASKTQQVGSIYTS